MQQRTIAERDCLLERAECTKLDMRNRQLGILKDIMLCSRSEQGGQRLVWEEAFSNTNFIINVQWPFNHSVSYLDLAEHNILNLSLIMRSIAEAYCHEAFCYEVYCPEA